MLDLDKGIELVTEIDNNNKEILALEKELKELLLKAKVIRKSIKEKKNKNILLVNEISVLCK
jgi:hypothetical protein